MSESKLVIRILGCGSSGGVPRIGNNWGVCDPDEPKNRRTRSSILVTRNSIKGRTRVLVDTSPDLREQLLAAKCSHLDAVLYTHDHADQCHGLDDLRPIAYATRRQVPVYMNDATRKTLHERFRYAFFQAENSVYPAILNDHLMPPDNQWSEINGEGGVIPFKPFEVDHGPNFKAQGFRIGNLVYTPDISDIPDASLSSLNDLDIWIIDALRLDPHPTHFNLETALAWIKRMQPHRAILTNLHVDMDYQTLCSDLPVGIVPAFDGMEVEVSL